MTRCLAILMLTSAAAAAEPLAFEGTWADRPAQCRLGQEAMDAPMILTRDGYDQHEAHCRFTSLGPDGDGWQVKAHCLVEGNAQPASFALRLLGDRLTITDEYGIQQLRRCR